MDTHQAIRQRATTKVLRAPENDAPLSDEQATRLHADLEQMIELASWAPFHHFAHPTHQSDADDRSNLPWRFHILEKPACLALNQFLNNQTQAAADGKWPRAWKSKIPKLLSGTGALVIVTWCPDPAQEKAIPGQLGERDTEHLCSAAAATQNLLLAATDLGYHSYWSSGGILKDHEVWEKLGIPVQQAFVGAIFISPKDMDGVECTTGAHRLNRPPVDSWANWVATP